MEYKNLSGGGPILTENSVKTCRPFVFSVKHDWEHLETDTVTQSVWLSSFSLIDIPDPGASRRGHVTVRVTWPFGVESFVPLHLVAMWLCRGSVDMVPWPPGGVTTRFFDLGGPHGDKWWRGRGAGRQIMVTGHLWPRASGPHLPPGGHVTRHGVGRGSASWTDDLRLALDMVISGSVCALWLHDNPVEGALEGLGLWSQPPSRGGRVTWPGSRSRDRGRAFRIMVTFDLGEGEISLKVNRIYYNWIY